MRAKATSPLTEGVTPIDRQGVTSDNPVAPCVTPLDVYSEHRWTRLQSQGWKWGKDGKVVSPDGEIMDPEPIFGDPAYQGVNATVGIVKIANPAACTFTDLPLDIQQQINKHCSEANQGQRAGTHSRAAMTERALHYQEVTG